MVTLQRFNIEIVDFVNLSKSYNEKGIIQGCNKAVTQYGVQVFQGKCYGPPEASENAKIGFMTSLTAPLNSAITLLFLHDIIAVKTPTPSYFSSTECLQFGIPLSCLSSLELLRTMTCSAPCSCWTSIVLYCFQMSVCFKVICFIFLFV